MVFLLISLFLYNGWCSAAEENAVAVNVNASNAKDGSNVIYAEDSEMTLDWREKVYYAPKDATFHCTITIENTGSVSGDLYVKIDFLMPGDIENFKLPVDLTGYYKWCYYDTNGAIPLLSLSPVKSKLMTLDAEDSVKLFDFVATDAFKFHGPILITAMLLDTELGTMLGIDSEMIFFNTEFKNWIRAHAAP